MVSWLFTRAYSVHINEVHFRSYMYMLSTCMESTCSYYTLVYMYMYMYAYVCMQGFIERVGGPWDFPPPTQISPTRNINYLVLGSPSQNYGFPCMQLPWLRFCMKHCVCISQVCTWVHDIVCVLAWPMTKVIYIYSTVAEYSIFLE